jgi:hypothetical protein
MPRIAKALNLLVALTAVETIFAVITASAAVSTAILATQPKSKPPTEDEL